MEYHSAAYGGMVRRTGTWFGSTFGLQKVADETSSWLGKTNASLSSVLTLILILTALGGGIAWISQTLASLQAAISALQGSIGTLTVTVGAMPRPADYEANAQHLHALDQRADELARENADNRIMLERINTQMTLILSHTTRANVPPN